MTIEDIEVAGAFREDGLGAALIFKRQARPIRRFIRGYLRVLAPIPAQYPLV